LSGPGVLDASRHHLSTQGARTFMNVLPGTTAEQLDAALLAAQNTTVLRWLIDAAPHPALVPGHGTTGLPERLARALCALAEVDPATPTAALTRDRRLTLVTTLTALRLPITGDRGFTFAEVTAGGVPLSEIRLQTMSSRIAPGLFICGEICDVDGRIGGFNFQWAWASGYLAGVGAARAILSP
jgi:predicted flavoprotein YhiN